MEVMDTKKELRRESARVLMRQREEEDKKQAATKRLVEAGVIKRSKRNKCKKEPYSPATALRKLQQTKLVAHTALCNEGISWKDIFPQMQTWEQRSTMIAVLLGFAPVLVMWEVIHNYLTRQGMAELFVASKEGCNLVTTRMWVHYCILTDTRSSRYQTRPMHECFQKLCDNLTSHDQLVLARDETGLTMNVVNPEKNQEWIHGIDCFFVHVNRSLIDSWCNGTNAQKVSMNAEVRRKHIEMYLSRANNVHIVGECTCLKSDCSGICTGQVIMLGIYGLIAHSCDANGIPSWTPGSRKEASTTFPRQGEDMAGAHWQAAASFQVRRGVECQWEASTGRAVWNYGDKFAAFLREKGCQCAACKSSTATNKKLKTKK